MDRNPFDFYTKEKKLLFTSSETITCVLVIWSALLYNLTTV